MNLGFRVFEDGYLDKFELGLVQISVWHRVEEDFQRVNRLAQRLRQQGRRFVIHPTDLYLSETRPEPRKHYLDTLKRYGQISDLGLIVHDETLMGGGRLCDCWRYAYKSALCELERVCPVAVENAVDSSQALWFWQVFAHSITFDIGHFGAAGMDCFKAIDNLSQDLLKKLDFIHLHRNNGRKAVGITDHWPLVKGCVELSVLKKLLKLKPEAKVILEVDGEHDIGNSLAVLAGTKW